jgi:hypothetical protein
VLKDDYGRKAVAREHRFGIFRHGAVIDVGAGLRPGVEADCIEPKPDDLHFTVSVWCRLHHLPRHQPERLQHQVGWLALYNWRAWMATSIPCCSGGETGQMHCVSLVMIFIPCGQPA